MASTNPQGDSIPFLKRGLNREFDLMVSSLRPDELELFNSAAPRQRRKIAPPENPYQRPASLLSPEFVDTDDETLMKTEQRPKRRRTRELAELQENLDSYTVTKRSRFDRSRTGSSDGDQVSPRPSSWLQEKRARRGSTGRLTQAEISARELLGDSETDEGDSLVTLDSDDDADGSLANLTRLEALDVTKKRGAINDVLLRTPSYVDALEAVAHRMRNQAIENNAELARELAQDIPAPTSSQQPFQPVHPTTAPHALPEQTLFPELPALESTAGLGDVSAHCALQSSQNSLSGFAGVGGLAEHLVLLREMVLLPLAFPVLRMALKPPRGVLFTGPPGTGKTHLARAMAMEASKISGNPVAFFVRNGADITSKWVGESERQLRELFAEAQKRAPSVIFFDEIDGLAPMRSSEHETSHAAVVATLLALMDGLVDRGHVVVMASTNRPDMLDPALRRPGRLERELHFPLPDAEARREILQIVLSSHQVEHRWFQSKFGEELVELTRGFSGADLRAVVTEAVLCSFRRRFPMAYLGDLSPLTSTQHWQLTLTHEDMRTAIQRVQPTADRAHRGLLSTNTHACQLQGSGGLTPTTPFAQLLSRFMATAAVDTLGQYWLPATRCNITAQRRLLATSSSAPQQTSESVSQVVFRLAHAPPPQIQQACLFALVGINDEPSICFVFAGLVQAYPTLSHRVIQLLLLQEPQEFLEQLDEATRVAPCIVILHNFSQWNRRAHPQVMAALSALRHVDICLVFAVDHLSEIHPLLTVIQMSNHLVPCQCNSQLSRQDMFTVLQRLVNSMMSQWEMTESHQQASSEYPPSPYPSPSSGLTQEFSPNSPLFAKKIPRRRKERQDRRMALRKWHRVHYRRIQLRYVLREWLAPVLADKTCAPLLHDPGTTAASLGRYKRWLQFLKHNNWKNFYEKDDENKSIHNASGSIGHGEGFVFGLNDLYERIDAGCYLMVSQFNDDLELLCTSLSGFFKGSGDSRAVRVRARAIQLRDSAILFNLKLSPTLIEHCAASVDVEDPGWVSEDTESEAENVKPKTAVVSLSIQGQSEGEEDNLNHQESTTREAIARVLDGCPESLTVAQLHNAAANILTEWNQQFLIGLTRRDVMEQMEHVIRKHLVILQRR